MLGKVAPTVMGTGFVGMVRIPEIAGHEHRLTAQMNARGPCDRLRRVVVLFKSDGQNPPVSSPAASRIARLTATFARSTLYRLFDNGVAAATAVSPAASATASLIDKPSS